MSEQIVVGRMLDSKRIETDDGIMRIDGFFGRAAWSFLRLQFGRSIDNEIKDHLAEFEQNQHRRLTKAERWAEFMRYFETKTQEIQTPRKIQFILDDVAGTSVMAVASLQHLLIPESEVYEMAERLIHKAYPKMQPYQVQQLHGQTYLLREEAGIQCGLQVYGGSIDTRQAITVSSWLRVKQCFNPLSWLGIGWFKGWTGRGSRDYERVLRIKVKEDLKPRLKAGIDLAVKKNDDLDARVKVAKKVAVKRSDAEVIMAALGLSYDLGARTIEQILDQLAQEPNSQWGMSMASSYVAAHGGFKKTPEKQKRAVEQKLSTISGAALLIDDWKEAKDKSLEWLKTHVKQGEVKKIDELIRNLKVKTQ